MIKKIIDVCCGSRMFWFDKKNPNVIFNDIRKEKHILCDGRVLDINPDTTMDFRKMEYKNGRFDVVIFDPPHLIKLGENSWMAKKYGVLGKNWKDDIKKGFDECWRILRKRGVMVFKWNTRDISIKELIKIIDKTPDVGHTTKKGGHTIWMLFYKN